ncbi:MAG: hypothetical protein KME46_34085 [Brasilonema angustatum HA4187-MV1]|jgi:hypothetical protein|nr:hypothetical protein [Brasilonema angustatum HA4187-MV1]
MSETKSTERIQLNLRFDGHKELYEAVKTEAARQKTSINSFVVDALKAALGWELEESSSQSTRLPLEAILAAARDELVPELDTLVQQAIAPLKVEIEELKRGKPVA